MQIIYRIAEAVYREEVGQVFAIKAIENREDGDVELPALAAVNGIGMVIIVTREDFNSLEDVNEYIHNLCMDEPFDFTDGNLVSYLPVNQFASMRQGAPQPEGELSPEMMEQMQAQGEMPIAMTPISPEEGEAVDVNDAEEEVDGPTVVPFPGNDNSED